MLRVLLKKQLLELTAGIRVNHKDGSMRSNTSLMLYALIYLYLFGVFAVVFGKMSVTLADAFCPLGLGWLFFALIGMMATVLGLLLTAFTTAQGLFSAKDNDLLLSMPILPKQILTARMLSIYIMSMLFSGTAYLPAVGVYFSRTKNVPALVFGILLWVLQGLVVLALASGLGYVVAAVTSRLKRKNVVTLLLSLLFLILYFGVYMNIQSLLAKVVLMGEEMAKVIRKWAYPLYAFGRASTGEALPLLIFAVFALLLFAICLYLLSRSFIRIATANRGTTAKAFAYKKTKAKSVPRALIWKEMKRFTSSANYMLNCGLGLVFCVAAVVYLAIKPETLTALYDTVALNVPEILDMKAMLAGSLTAALMMMCDIAAPSVSLEGKNIWILQSLPVEPYRILRAKSNLQLYFSLPAAYLVLGCLAWLFRMDAVSILAAALYVPIFIRISADLAVMFNLLMPNLHWTNEIVPIKQGTNVLLSIVSCMVQSVGLAVGYWFLAREIGAWPAMGVVLAVTAVIAVLLDRWMRTRGVEKWMKLA